VSARWVGLDFGTTNSAVALSDAAGPPRLVVFPTASGPRPTFERLEVFLLLIKNELGYQLHQAVQRTKFELSAAMQSEFSFVSGPVTIRKNVTRSDFERWIADELTGDRHVRRSVDGGLGVGVRGDRPRIPDRRFVVRAGSTNGFGASSTRMSTMGSTVESLLG
jgi:hypothetical protein